MADTTENTTISATTSLTEEDVVTLQSNIKSYKDKDFINNYSLFLGGIDTTNDGLKAYDPLKSGRGRIFFLRMPTFMQKLMPRATKRVQHMFEYGFTKIDGLGDLTLETETMTGGYVGKQISLPTLAKDDTNQITIGLYEFAGSPIREYLDMWITGICDKETGYSTYHGLCDPKSAGADVLDYAQYNHTAEAIYLTTDPTGLSKGIEYCCLLTNMFPTQSNRSHFNYNSGESSVVQIDVPFSCNKYESSHINEIGKMLLERFDVMKSSLKFKYTRDHKDYNQENVNDLYKPYIYSWGIEQEGAEQYQAPTSTTNTSSTTTTS